MGLFQHSIRVMHNALEKLQRGSQRRTKQWVWSIFEIISTKSLVVHCVSNHNCESLVNLLGPLFVISKKLREILCLNNIFSDGSLRLGRNNLYNSSLQLCGRVVVIYQEPMYGSVHLPQNMGAYTQNPETLKLTKPKSDTTKKRIAFLSMLNS